MKPFELHNVTCQIGKKPLLEGISLSVEKSDFLGVIGPNGAGKSTLLRLLNATMKPSGGKLSLLGKDLVSASQRDILRLRRKIATVPQIMDFNLSIPLTAREVVEIARIGRNGPGRSLSPIDTAKMEESMELMGISSLANRTFRSLSGGEKQKVQMARVLAQEPDILLLDEPTSSLDMDWQERLVRLIEDIHLKNKFTVVMTTHITGHLPSRCERIVLLKQGRILFDGRFGEALTKENLEKLYDCRVDILSHSGRIHCFGIGAKE
ncbi:ABC transporter ATP-binding protein [Candidatus Sumerlaeota bacterium]|nr:ABC transporter ATP-binding protein [Candidatus Sumerlaeota bacterium]